MGLELRGTRERARRRLCRPRCRRGCDASSRWGQSTGGHDHPTPGEYFARLPVLWNLIRRSSSQVSDGDELATPVNMLLAFMLFT